MTASDQTSRYAGVPPKIVFVGRSTAHLTYYESVLKAFCERGANVRVLFDEEWSVKAGVDGATFAEIEARFPGAACAWLRRRSDRHRDDLFALRELRSYRSYLVRDRTTPFYVGRWRGYLDERMQRWTDRPAGRWALKTTAAELALRLAERAAPADPGILAYLRAEKPDLVFLSPLNMRYSEETDYLKAARHLRIPTAMSVLSWDNLTTKGLVQMPPDLMFVWNEVQAEDAVKIHGAPRRNVVIAGSPFFDKWFDVDDETWDRETFCAHVGLDPEKKFIVYLGSSANIAKDESWFVESLVQSLRASASPGVGALQVLVRPHPANARVYDSLERLGVKRWPKDGALPQTREQFAEMRATFRHAVAAVGVNTSGMLDTVLAGLPTISVLLPRYAATQADSVHFQQLRQARAIQVIDNLNELEIAISRVLEGHDDRAQEKERFAMDFARPRGLNRSAGDFIAEAVIERVSARK